jgi:hypothetical protein
VRPTRVSTLALTAAAGAVVGFSIGSLLERLGFGLPRVSWVTIGLLVLLAVALLVSSRRVASWVSGDRPTGPDDALRMGRLVALAKAGSVFGAVMTGGYLGLMAAGIPLLDLPYGRAHVAWALGAALAALGVAVAALQLEKACRLPSDGDPTGSALGPQPG